MQIGSQRSIAMSQFTTAEQLSASWVLLSANLVQLSASRVQSDRATLQLTTMQFERAMRGSESPTSLMEPKLR